MDMMDMYERIGCSGKPPVGAMRQEIYEDGGNWETKKIGDWILSNGEIYLHKVFINFYKPVEKNVPRFMPGDEVYFKKTARVGHFMPFIVQDVVVDGSDVLYFLHFSGTITQDQFVSEREAYLLYEQHLQNTLQEVREKLKGFEKEVSR